MLECGKEVCILESKKFNNPFLGNKHIIQFPLKICLHSLKGIFDFLPTNE